MHCHHKPHQKVVVNVTIRGPINYSYYHQNNINIINKHHHYWYRAIKQMTDVAKLKRLTFGVGVQAVAKNQ